MVIEAIRRFQGDLEFESVLDVGVADGLTAGKTMSEFPFRQSVGIDLSKELMQFGQGLTDISFIQADAIELPFKENCFELVTATAVIEHVHSVSHFLNEVRRILKPNGLLAITTPDPFWDRLVSRLFPNWEEMHVETLNLERIEEYFRDVGFEFLYGSRFMASPVGLPFEVVLERCMRAIGLGSLLLNQVAVARRTD